MNNSSAFDRSKMGDLCIILTAPEGASRDMKGSAAEALRQAGFGHVIVLPHGYKLAGWDADAIDRLLGRWMKRIESCADLQEAESFARCYTGLSRARGIPDETIRARLMPALLKISDGTVTEDQLFWMCGEAWADLGESERSCPDCGGDMGAGGDIPQLHCDCGKTMPCQRAYVQCQCGTYLERRYPGPRNRLAEPQPVDPAQVKVIDRCEQCIVCVPPRDASDTR